MASSSTSSLSLTTPHLTTSPTTKRLSSLPSTLSLTRSPTPTRLSLSQSQSQTNRRTIIKPSAASTLSTNTPTAESSLVEKSVNTIRFLAVDSVEKANSGHPGLPMGCAPVGHVLYDEVMRYNPKNPFWFNRDRFVLSAGHGCMLQYALLHLAGYDSVKEADLKEFRQWGSRTPGHPENFETPGIEVTTGPLDNNYSYTNCFINMGANFSNMESVVVERSSNPSPILTFHSSAKWKAHFEASKQTNKLMVIDFTAAWCGPCKYMNSVIKEFAAKYKDVEFIKIDVDELMEVASAFQVQAMPTFILIKNGKVVEKVVGAKKEDLQKMIEKRRRSLSV